MDVACGLIQMLEYFNGNTFKTWAVFGLLYQEKAQAALEMYF